MTAASVSKYVLPLSLICFFWQKTMVINSSKSKNAGKVEYAINGRPIHRESEAPKHANYSPNYKAIQSKNPCATIGKCQKEMLYNIEMKEVRARQGPSTYRPNYDRILK